MAHPYLRSDRSIKLPWRGEKGQALVETALVLPVMFGLILGMMVMFLAFYTHEYLSELAREGTRYAAVHGSSCKTSAGASCTQTASQINTYVAGINLPNIGGGTMSASNVTTTFPDGDQVPPHRVKIVVTYSFPYRIPFVMNTTLSMSSSSVVDIIQ
jgi:Flp pilus assembly protein TadG